MAIARRESAFFPSARSPVGARGLMQLMPATGAAVARKAGLKLQTRELYDIERNIDLGSVYYRQLLERFDGKRPLALAAYNAGPSRVQHWIREQAPMDVWIETIPYRETRDYVKAVLAYSVVFDFRLGRDSRLLTPTEQTASL
jgi:soluble lytic murein transglycosylase